MVGSASLFIPSVFFPEHRYQQYFVFTTNIGICCFMFAAAYVIGEPRNDSSDCNFQAISSKLFSLAGFAWEAAICYSIYLISTKMRRKPKPIVLHTLCWLIPVLLTALPFSTEKIGTYNYSERGYCGFISRTHGSGAVSNFWRIATFGFPLFIVFSISVYSLASIGIVAFKANRLSQRGLKVAVTSAREKLYLYPVILVVSWFLQLIIQLVLLNGKGYGQFPDWVIDLSQSLQLLQGFFIGAYFWYVNPQMREKVMLRLGFMPPKKLTAEVRKKLSARMNFSQPSHDLDASARPSANSTGLSIVEVSPPLEETGSVYSDPDPAFDSGHTGITGVFSDIASLELKSHPDTVTSGSTVSTTKVKPRVEDSSV
jgi:hypothetical protein